MTTTSFLQKYPDYYNSIEDCIKFDKNYNKEQSNSRYKNFNQINFTAGDEEQFNKYRYDKNNLNEIDPSKISLKNNIYNDFELYSKFDKYNNLNALSVTNTFKYIFNKFKKGIFVKIVNNELKVFLPFSNVNFVNEWSHNIKIDPKFNGDIYTFFNYISEIEGYKFNKNTINSFINSWYSNNSLLRYEYPIYEGDTNVSCIKNMLEELCKNRKLPDIELFINRRDFPLLTKGGYEPYYNLWNSMEKPLVSHNYNKYVPILSMSSFEHFSDILIPTHDDWIRIQNKENKWFPRSSQQHTYNFTKEWGDKIPIAIFRGSSTGSGVTIDTNQRLKLAYISKNTHPDENGIPYIDAGITKWNMRAKKIINNPCLQTLDVSNIPFELSNKMTPEEQSKYKYIIHVDGHVSAFRLSYELSMNSVILIVKSKWKIWYSDLLKPYVHYIPIKEDLSDIIDIIKWCRNNDKKCQEISKNAKDFYNKYLQKDSIFDYLQKLFIDLKKDIGFYKYIEQKPLDLQFNVEYSFLFDNIKLHNKKIENISFPNSERCYGFLKGINYVVNIIKNNNLNKFKLINNIFMNKNGRIDKYKLSNFNFTFKISNDEQKIKEHIHETYIGTNCINNLLKYIPNFVYNFGIVKQDDNYIVINEYIEGETFQNYIKNKDFNFKEYLLILIQLCLALEFSQKKCGFVHYDLTVWNIIIQKLPEEITIDYPIDHNKIFRIKTNIVPIIIDYGKSHVFHENKHYGYINMFNFNTCSDMLSLLITSIYQIVIDQKLSKYDFTNLLTLSNFISNTKFCNSKFKNAKDIRNFFHNAKKYSNLINTNKYELEKLSPIDLIHYINKNIKYNLSYQITNNYENIMNKLSSEQVFNFSISNNNDERLQSYLNIFRKVKHINFDELNSIYLLYFIVYLENILISNYYSLLEFLKEEEIENTYDNYLFNSLKILNKKVENIDINLHNILTTELKKLNNIDNNFTEDDLFFKDKILTKIQVDININTNILKITDIIEDIILNKSKLIIKYDKNFYKQISQMLSVNTKEINNKICNYNSLKYLFKKIY